MMDWEFVGNGIAQIGSMVAGTIMEKYRQDQAEQQFLKRFEETMKLQEPYKIAENDRIISRMKAGVQQGIQAKKEYAKWKLDWDDDMTTYFHSEELQKRVEKAMKGDDESDKLWVRSWQRTSGRIQRGEDLDKEDESFVESLNSIARATINNKRYEKQKYDNAFQLQADNLQKGLLMLEGQMEKNRIYFEDKEREWDLRDSTALLGGATTRLEREHKVLTSRSAPGQRDRRAARVAGEELKNVEEAIDFISKATANSIHIGKALGKRQAQLIKELQSNVSGVKDGSVLSEYFKQWGGEAHKIEEKPAPEKKQKKEADKTDKEQMKKFLKELGIG